MNNLIGSKWGEATILEYRGLNELGHPLYHCHLIHNSEVPAYYYKGTDQFHTLPLHVLIRLRGYEKNHSGLRECRTYNSFNNAHIRCYSSYEKHVKYKERGIQVCDRWRRDKDLNPSYLAFSNFLEDMGARPIGKTLDRIDNEGHYEPDNCRWATIKEQNRNRSNVPHVLFNGERLPLIEIAERLQIDQRTLKRMIEKREPIFTIV